MQTLGYNAQECKDFFLNCVESLRHFRKIQPSTYENWKQWVGIICKKFENNPNIYFRDLPGRYFCVEMLSSPEAFQNIMQHTETEARGQSGGLSNTTIANYMQMLTFIMMNIELCTEDENILTCPVFSKKNIRRWTMAWGALNIDATNSRHWEYTKKIVAAEADWGKLIATTRRMYERNKYDLRYVYRHLLVLTYDALCARNDYGDCTIYFRGDIIPADKVNTTNYIDLNTYTIHVNDTKNQYEIGNHQYKTYQELSDEYLEVLATSLRIFPRRKLFTNNRGGLIPEHHFGDFIKGMLGNIFAKRIERSTGTVIAPLITGCDMIRHLFAQFYYRMARIYQQGANHSTHEETYGLYIFLNSIEKMLHSQSTHMNNYITPYLEMHGTNIKVLDNITREYIFKPQETKVFTPEDREFERVKYYARRFLKRMELFHDNFHDVFHKELFGIVKINGRPAYDLTKEEFINYLTSCNYDSDSHVRRAIQILRNLNENSGYELPETPTHVNLDFSDYHFFDEEPQEPTGPILRTANWMREHMHGDTTEEGSSSDPIGSLVSRGLDHVFGSDENGRVAEFRRNHPDLANMASRARDYISSNISRYARSFFNNTTGEYLTPETAVTIESHPDTARQENVVPRAPGAAHNTRSQTAELRGAQPPRPATDWLRSGTSENRAYRQQTSNNRTKKSRNNSNTRQSKKTTRQPYTRQNAATRTQRRNQRRTRGRGRRRR